MLIPVVFLAAATYTDIKQRKIKNWTTYPMALLGIALSDNIVMSIIIGVTLGIVLAVLPGFSPGMGDIKLAIACGTWFSNIWIAVYFILLVLSLLTIFNIVIYVQQNGVKDLLRRLRTELFLSVFKIFDAGKINQTPMAPFMLVSFVATMFFLKLYV